VTAGGRGDLRRVIGFWGGKGDHDRERIFRKPQTLAGLVPDAVVILSLWTAFGLISLAARSPRAELAPCCRGGGPYVSSPPTAPPPSSSAGFSPGGHARRDRRLATLRGA
jgi:hypothetical protein